MSLPWCGRAASLDLGVLELDSEKNKLVEGWKEEVMMGDVVEFVIQNV